MSFFNGGGDAEHDDGVVDMSMSFGEYGDYDASMDFQYPTDDSMLMSQESTEESVNSSGFFGAKELFVLSIVYFSSQNSHSLTHFFLQAPTSTT
jgi:hypothetical protein